MIINLFQHQHPSQFSKLLESANLATLHSSANNNSSNTNSNLFSSPTLSSESNRRHLVGNSKLARLKYQLDRKLVGYCSWKTLALFLLFIGVSLLSLTVYLAIMRIYNLDWQLARNQVTRVSHSSDVAPMNHRIGKLLQDRVMPSDMYYIRMHLYSSIHVKFNVSISKHSSVGVYMGEGELPSLTKFKYFETLNGKELLPIAGNRDGKFLLF